MQMPIPGAGSSAAYDKAVSAAPSMQGRWGSVATRFGRPAGPRCYGSVPFALWGSPGGLSVISQNQNRGPKVVRVSGEGRAIDE